MKIVENTTDRLILEHVPWRDLGVLLGCLSLFVGIAVLFSVAGNPLGGLIFLVIGGVPAALGIYFSVARSQLIFDRAAGVVDHRRRSFRGTTKHPLPFDKVNRLYVGQNGPDKGRLFIEVTDAMDAGHHPFPQTPARLDDIKTIHAIATEWIEA